MAAFESSRIYAAEELVLRLEQQILEERLGPGDRLGTKAEVAKRYSFAGGTVNEAVILLETRGIVEARPGPGGGLFVAQPASRVRLDRLFREFPLGLPGLADCLVVREALEPPLFLDAARHCTGPDAVELHRILTRMKAGSADRATLFKLGWHLHRRIAEISSIPLLRTIYLAVLHLIEERSPGQQVTDPTPVSPRETVAVHQELVDALVAGAPARLTQAMRLQGRLPMEAKHSAV